MKQAYSNIKYGIANLIKWLPIIWRDRDWDYHYLMIILEKKLYNMSLLHRNYGHTETSEQVADELKYASHLAGRIASENYTEETFEDKLYLIEKNEMKLVPIGSTGASRVEFVGLTEDERKELLKLHRLENELLEKDIEKLFDLMKKDIRNWWD